MDNWEKFDETTTPPKEAFYSELNLEGISDADYAHAQKVWKVFGIKNHDEYHDLYTQSDTLLLEDVFENFRDKCNEIYKLDPAYFVSRDKCNEIYKRDPIYFVSTPGLAWQACLKKTGVTSE